MNLIDLHCHLLPGIDDGPADVDESFDLARAYLAAGITRVAATPHLNLRHSNSPEEIRDCRLMLSSRLTEEGIPLKVEGGAELAANLISGLEDSELDLVRLGGGDWLLVEPKTDSSSFEIHESLFAIQDRGYKVLLAHPERIPALQDDLALVADLVRTGVRNQITAESLTGVFGRSAEKCARKMLDRGLVHVAASDAHHATERPPGLSNILKRTGYKDQIQWLCSDMPSWILDGGEEPARPDSPKALDNEGNGPRLLGRLGSGLRRRGR